VLYVGKAKNLKNRVTSYTRVNQLNRRIKLMVTSATHLKWQTLESELEALLVEAELIRTHQPEYNILLKDDKTPLYLHITKGDFPLVQTIRKKDVDTGRASGTVLGPFSSSYKVQEVLKLVRPIFRWCALPNNQKNKPCFYYHLDTCSGACVGEISSDEYKNDIAQLILFLRGKKNEVVTDIKNRMKAAAEAKNFELAARLRDEIALITSVTSHQYKLKPDLILPQLRESRREEGLIQLRKLISEHFGVPKTISLKRIEGYDVSNIQGKHAAVSMVTFIDGKSETSEYKVFSIRTLDTPNDYGMLKEALARRQNHPEWGKPDLWVIDGGKGQLRAALLVKSWDMPVISIAKDPDRILIPKLIPKQKIKKNQKNEQISRTIVPEDESLTDRYKIEYVVIKLPERHPALQLIQAIRDESHRFSRRQHHTLHKNNLLA